MSERASERANRRRVLGGLAALGTGGFAVDVASGRAGDGIRGQPEGGARDRLADVTSRTERAADEAPTLDPVSRFDLRGAAETVVDDDGTTVYCSIVDGFAVVDASDPTNPVVVSERRQLRHDGDGPMRPIMDVKVSGDRLLVSGPNQYSDVLSGFFLYDVSDPASPERVAVNETRYDPHNAFVDGDFVYLTGSLEVDEPVVIYDVSDDDPEEVARWTPEDADDAWSDVTSPYRQAHDVYVQDGTMYVAYWDAGTWLVDVRDPTDPEVVLQLGGHDPDYLADLDRLSSEFEERPGNSHYVQPSPGGFHVFVGKESLDRPETARDGGPGGIECWDLTEREPVLRSVLAPPEPAAGEDETGWTAHNFGVAGDRLYASWHGGGVRVYDVSDLAAPRLLGQFQEPASTWFWTAEPLASGFVATSYLDPGNPTWKQRRGVDATVFVFPEPDGGDAVPASTMDRLSFPEPGDDPLAAIDPVQVPSKPVRLHRRVGGTERSDQRTTSNPRDVSSGATAGGDGPSGESSSAATDADDEAMPFVDDVLALAAGGAGLLWLRRRLREDSGSDDDGDDRA